MDLSFIATYLWWRLIGMSLCAVMLPAYLVYFQKIESNNKIAIIIFGTTVVCALAYIFYSFGFMAFITGVILWIISAYLINKLFAWVSKGEEY
jgi:hypothetical protein